MPMAATDKASMPAEEPTKAFTRLPTSRTSMPTNSHLPRPEMSRLITVARLAITKNTPAVPPKAVMTSSGPFLKPSTMAIMRESIKPMKKVKPSSTGTPVAECLDYSMANMKPKAPTRKTTMPTPPDSMADRLVGAFGFMLAIEKTKHSATGVPVLLGFTFFMGLMLSRMIAMVLGFKNGPELVMTAFGGTAGVFFVMASLATVIKRDISGLGKWLFVGMLVLLVGSLVNAFVGSSAGMLALSVAAIGIFSAYMLYDIKQIIDGGETNYISATLSLYLDLYNVFQNLLALLGIFGGERE